MKKTFFLLFLFFLFLVSFKQIHASNITGPTLRVSSDSNVDDKISISVNGIVGAWHDGCSVIQGGRPFGAYVTAFEDIENGEATVKGNGISWEGSIGVREGGGELGECYYANDGILEIWNPGYSELYSGSDTIPTSNLPNGSYSAKVEICNGERCANPVTINFTVSHPSNPPTCSPSNQSVNTGQSASFSASDGDGNFSWSAPGGSPSGGSGGNFSTSYSSSGTKTVTVTSAGQSDSCTVSVSVPPVGAPVCSPSSQSAQQGDTVNFSATDGDGNYSWSAPNSSGGTTKTGTGSNFSTTYSSSGTKTVTVTSAGQSDSCSVSVSSQPSPDRPEADIRCNNSGGSCSISYNSSAQIEWCGSNNHNCSDATSCTVSYSGGSWSGISGNEQTGNLTSSRNYTLICTGPGGSNSDSVSVNVSGQPTATPTPSGTPTPTPTPTETPPGTCQDPNATNYGGPLPCTYDEVCTTDIFRTVWGRHGFMGPGGAGLGYQRVEGNAEGSKRGFMAFDTRAIPDENTIESAFLRAFKFSTGNGDVYWVTDPFTYPLDADEYNNQVSYIGPTTGGDNTEFTITVPNNSVEVAGDSTYSLRDSSGYVRFATQDIEGTSSDFYPPELHVSHCAPPPQDQAPIGYLDEANCTLIGGWSFDPDTSGSEIAVHFYRDGPAGSGTFLASTNTTGLRQDVNDAFGITGNHGYTISTPASLKDGNLHTVYAYGINSNPVGQNTLLTNSPKTVQCAVNPTASNITVTQPNYCLSGPAATVNWDYSDPNSSPQGSYQVQIDREGSFQNPELDSGQIFCEGCRSYSTPQGILQFNVTYRARVRVWNQNGNASDWIVSSTWKTPNNAYPQVDFSYAPANPGQTQIVPNSPVQFTDQTVFYTSGGGNQWNWLFGDGGSSTQQNPQHTYTQANNYNITLTATDSQNQSCSITAPVNVQVPNPIWKEVNPGG